jgi:pyruvate formate lyase activating enzyme
MKMRHSCSNTETTIDRGTVQGVLFDVKRYAIHDGPGVRTTAFFKGCPLSCDWCHNPESQSPEAELLLRPNRCVGCGECVSICPEKAVRMDGALSRTDRERCSVCGACVSTCPADARSIVGAIWTADALADELVKDALFFDQSGGGVTCSGGEPLLQSSFCAALLHLCHQRGIQTAVDTCGHADEPALRRVADEADLFLYDLKLMDDERHRLATGASNAKVLRNAERLDRWGKRIWIRVPLIPGINDDDENLNELAAFVRTLSAVEALQVLPYHRGGEEKWKGLGKEKRLPIEPDRVPEAVDRAVRLLSERIDVPVTRGG